MEIGIDFTNGDLVLENFKITSNTKSFELPIAFQLGEEFLVGAINKKVPCLFAKTFVEEKNEAIKIELRFEDKILVSIFIEITDKNRQFQDEFDYYGSNVERVNYHLAWLKTKLGQNQGNRTVYNWGVAGVGQDKSGGVFIFMHNKNNSWAIG